MKAKLLFLFFLVSQFFYAQLGNTGHFPYNTLGYVPSGYSSTNILMRQGNSINNASNPYISNIDVTDLFVNFTYDTSGKNVYLVYTTNGSNPSKTNGTVVSCSFSNYSDPNRVWVGKIPASANVAGDSVKYVFYISNSDLSSSYGRIAGDGYQTSWTEGNSYFSYPVWSASSAGGNWSSTSTWKSGSVPTSSTLVLINSSNSVTLDQNTSVSGLLIRGAFTASDGTSRMLTITSSAAGQTATLMNNGSWNNGTGGSTVVFTGAPSSGDAVHLISGNIGFQNITINKTGGSSNVGASFGSGSTISGTLEIGSGGYVATAPPTNFYNISAILKFNQGSGATYDVNASDYSWSTTQVPQNITIASGIVNLNAERTATGNLLINGGTLVLNSNNPNLTIEGNWIISSGGFTPNSGTVTLSGVSNDTLNVTSGINMGNLVIAKSSQAKTVLASNASANVFTINAGATFEIRPGMAFSVNSSGASFTNNGILNLLSDATGTAIMLTPVTISGSGTANVQQYLSSARNWYVSTPVTGATLPYGGYSYNEPGASWTSQNAGASMTPGVGYIITPTAVDTVKFSGTLNAGTINITLSRKGSTYTGFNLVGNPFPAYLDAKALLINNSSNASAALSTIWYRTKNGGTWSFPTYNASSGVGVPSNNLEFIPPMQAFWVRATSDGASFAFSNSMCSLNTTGSAIAFNSSPAPVNKVLRLQAAAGDNTDQAVIYFNPAAMNGLDDYDSPKMLNGSASTVPDLYTMEGNEPLIINGMDTIPYDTEIPLTLNANAASTNTFTISALEFSNFDPNTHAYLIDHETNSKTDLTTDSYTFTADGTMSSRFSVLFTSSTLATEIGSTTRGGLQVYTSNNHDIVVKYNGTETGPQRVNVYNAMGALIYSKTFTGNQLITPSMSEGMYVVEWMNQTGRQIKKVMVQ